MARFTVVAFHESETFDEAAQIVDHLRTAAQHGAVARRRERRQSDLVEELGRLQMMGDAPDMAERLARHGRIIDELLAHQFTEDLVLRQHICQIIAISEICYETAAVNEYDTFELLIGLDVADKAQEWCEPGSGTEKIEILARQQVVDN